MGGKYAALLPFDGILRVYDLEKDFQLHKQIEAHEDTIIDLVELGESVVVTCGLDNSIKVINYSLPEEREVIFSLSNVHG
jgi:WD40 repeat protein